LSARGRQRPPPPGSPGSPHLPDTFAPHRVLDVMELIETEARWSRRAQRLAAGSYHPTYIAALATGRPVYRGSSHHRCRLPRRDPTLRSTPEEAGEPVTRLSPLSGQASVVTGSEAAYPSNELDRSKPGQMYYEEFNSKHRASWKPCSYEFRSIIIPKIPKKSLTARASGGRIYLPTHNPTSGG
jgi:hypothetical protein